MKKPIMWILTRSDKNQALQPLEMARGLKFCTKEVEILYYPVAKTKALISFAVTAKLICVFVLAYAKRWFSHDVAHINVLGFVCNHVSHSIICLNFFDDGNFFNQCDIFNLHAFF